MQGNDRGPRRSACFRGIPLALQLQLAIEGRELDVLGARSERREREQHRDQSAQCTAPVQAVASTTRPNAMRYHAKGMKLCVEM